MSAVAGRWCSSAYPTPQRNAHAALSDSSTPITMPCMASRSPDGRPVSRVEGPGSQSGPWSLAGDGSARARSNHGDHSRRPVRDDDVGLSEGERAAFDDLARRLTDVRVERNEHRHRRFDRWRRRTVMSWMLLTAGGAALLTGLFAGNLWISGAGVLVLVTA